MGNNMSTQKNDKKENQNNNNNVIFDKYLLNNNEIENCFGSPLSKNIYYGMIYYKNKNSYHGQWKIIKDKIIIEDCEGSMIYNDGTKYKGGLMNCQFDGYGKMELYTGASYEGFWKNGKRNGHGKMIYEDGTIIDDDWIDGVCTKRSVDHYHSYNPQL
jgi:hypothetical protein